MSQRIRKNSIYLQLLLKTHKSQQKALLNSISPDQLKAISEIALNILHGGLPLSSSQKKRLTPYRKAIRLIGHKKSSQKSKKRTLIKNIKVLIILLKSAETILKSL